MRILHPDTETTRTRIVETTDPQPSPLSGERRGTRDAGQKAAQPAADSLERRLALDLLDVLEGEVPDVDAGLVGLAIAEEARRRRVQDAGAWGDRERAS